MTTTPLYLTSYTGTIILGGIPLRCAVLERAAMAPLRVLDVATALCFFDVPVASFLELARLPYLQPWFRRYVQASVMPIPYRDHTGQEYVGIDTDLFAEVVQAYWEASLAHALPPQALETGKRCAALMKAFATYAAPWVLVDEATGYQVVRAPDALQRRLAALCGDQPEVGEALLWLCAQLDVPAAEEGAP
jgi:hypothetical protein